MDFYPTLDPYVVPALWRVLVGDTWPGDVWEPAAGEGHMARALAAVGLHVTATDLEDYEGGGMGGLDFLAFEKPLAPSVITNPPFSLAAEFIDHALGKLGVRYLALLLKADFYCAAKRADAYDARPPTQIAYVAWRVDFTGEGQGPLNVAWYIWTPDPPRPPIVLRRPS